MKQFLTFSRAQMKTLTILGILLLLEGGYSFVRDYMTRSSIGSAPWQAEALAEYRPPFLLDINLSPADSLELLPGIGPVLAARIVEYRRQYGDFASVDSLINVPGLSPATLEKIRPYFSDDGQ